MIRCGISFERIAINLLDVYSDSIIYTGTLSGAYDICWYDQQDIPYVFQKRMALIVSHDNSEWGVKIICHYDDVGTSLILLLRNIY